MALTTTLERIIAAKPCKECYVTLLGHFRQKFPFDREFSIATVLESNELLDALWCLRAIKKGASVIIAIAQELVDSMTEYQHADTNMLAGSKRNAKDTRYIADYALNVCAPEDIATEQRKQEAILRKYCA